MKKCHQTVFFLDGSIRLKGDSMVVPLPASFKHVFLLMWMILFTGCTTTAFHTHQSCEGIPPQTRVLVMPLDIQLFELTTGGLWEPRADWTQHAKQYSMRALQTRLDTTKDMFIRYEPPPGDFEQAHLHQQLIKLHETVGNAIRVHAYYTYGALPTKKGKFDWGLGENVRSLRDRYQADYAMFIFIRDSYTSGGRAALIIGAALLGSYVPGGQQLGFASLVDLNTGRIVWFNRIRRSAGDLRTPAPARKTMQHLLKGCPL